MPTFTTEEIGATEILKKEHQNIKDLFRQFDDAVSNRQKKSIGDAALREIEAQTCLAEDVFYPAVRRQVGERQRVMQALAGHDVTKLLVKELRALPAGEQYNGRFDLLKSNVLQLIDNEESELMPRVEQSQIDLERLGKEMLQVKTRITQNGRKAFFRKTGAVTLGLVAIGAVAWFMNKERY